MNLNSKLDNVLKNGWWHFDKDCINCLCQFKEETGTDGEQRASNKIDVNKARKEYANNYSFFLAV